MVLGFGRAGLFHSSTSTPPICTVEVLPRHRVWYLKPKEPEPPLVVAATHNEDAPPPRSEDTVIDGHVVVNLELPRRIDEMHVELTGTQAMSLRGQWISYPTLELSSAINVHEGEDDATAFLPAGQHEFYWTFVVPADTAPKERLGEFDEDVSHAGIHLPHGGQGRARTRHMVRVTLTHSAPAATLSPATPPSSASRSVSPAGTRSSSPSAFFRAGFGGHHAAVIGNNARDHAHPTTISAEKEVRLQTNGNENGVADGLSCAEEILHPVLGPVRCGLYTRFLMVNGFLKFTLFLPEVLQDCTLVETVCQATQYCRLRDMRAIPSQAVSEEEELRPLKIPLWTMSREEARRTLHRGQEMLIQQVVRLPNDNMMRSSTNPWAKTGIRFSHTIGVALRYTAAATGPDVIKELSITFPAVVSMCNCTLDLQLPTYMESAAATAALASKSKGANAADRPALEYSAAGIKPGCLCMISDYISKEHIERWYGVGEGDDDGRDPYHGITLANRRAKWEETD